MLENGVDGWMLDCSNSSALAMELLQISATIPSSMLDKRTLVCHEEGFQVPAPFKVWWMIGYTRIYFLTHIHHDKG